MVQPLGKKMLVWTVLLEVLFVEASFYIDRIVQNTEKKLVLSNPRFGDGLQYEGLSPKFAIDGKRWHEQNKNFAHSKNTNNPTFKVDLQNDDIKVGKVLIFPRQYNDKDNLIFNRYEQMKVRIGSTVCELNWLNPTGLDDTSIEELKESGIEFDCKGVMGSKIVVENGNDYIQISEIEAYEHRPKLVLSNPRFDDDGYYITKSSAVELLPQKAIDGKWLSKKEKFTPHYTASKTENRATKFFVDLPNSHVKVQKIIIYPRQDDNYEQFDRYEELKVKIGEKSCTTNQKLDADSVKASRRTGLVFYCNSLSGSRIEVENGASAKYLNFAEIVAFDSTVRENIIIHPNYHLKFSMKIKNLGTLNKFRSIMSFELNTSNNNNQLATINDPSNYPRFALPDNFYDKYLRDLEGRAIQINHLFQYHDDKVKNKRNLMLQDYKFFPETGTHKWVNFEFIKYNSDLFVWINGKKHNLFNQEDGSEYRNGTLPSLKEDTLGNLKVFHKHDYNDENYVEDFEIRDLTYEPFPNKKTITNNRRSKVLFDINLSKITSTSIQLETFSDIPQLKAKLMKKNECQLIQQVRKRRSTTSETSNPSEQMVTTVAASM